MGEICLQLRTRGTCSWVRWCSVSGDQLWQWTILHVCRWPKLTENMVITCNYLFQSSGSPSKVPFGSIWGKGYYLIFTHKTSQQMMLDGHLGVYPILRHKMSCFIKASGFAVSFPLRRRTTLWRSGVPVLGHRKSQLTGADWKKKWKPGGWWGETSLNWFRLQSPGFAESMIWRIFPMGNPPSTDSHEDLIFGSQKREDFCRLQWPMVHICLTSNVIVGGS